MSELKTAQHFEAIKYSLRQSKDGVVVAFVVQPDDVRPELMALPVGARVMIAWSQIGDDEKPIGGGVLDSSHPGEKGASREPAPVAAPEAKPKRERFLSEQCALVCKEPRFMMFMRDVRRAIPEASAEETVKAVKRYCRVNSRSELDTGDEAANRWRDLHAQYRNYIADQDYAESIRR